MCYMAVAMAASKKKRLVGVRELRQNLSVYLDRVKVGETLQVTEFGRVVALLTPLPAEKLSPLERIVREGRATAPVGSLKDRPRPKPAPAGTPSSEEMLAWDRDERLL
jgi:antitoxin (DNA-binding transcriptional repressor) of toxin-antitoxin stability system